MRIAIFGSGGVGGYFGGRLAATGEDVVFIARGGHLQVLREEGLQVESVAGDFTVRPVEVTDDPGQVGDVDFVIVAVKGWQLREAAEQMRPLVAEDTLVVPLLNGVEAPSILGEALAPEHVLGGLCGIVAYKSGPGRICHAGVDPFVRFGRLDGADDARSEALIAAFEHARVQAEIPEDIQVAMWEKLVFIASVSSVGAIARAPLGVMREVPETRQLITAAMCETVAVGAAHGVSIQEEAVDRAMGFVDRLPPESTTSMQRDLMAGRRSELEAQSGAVVRLGREAGVATPAHGFLYAGLLPLELRARGELEY